MSTQDDLDIGGFLASPRHGHHFRVDDNARRKIETRLQELLATGRLRGKTPIINVQTDRGIVELHDGNASVVAWLVYARKRGIVPSLSALRASFGDVVVLENRKHPNGETWHPYVPPEVQCAPRLRIVSDPEQGGRLVRQAVTNAGHPVFFDDSDYFSGRDASETMSSMADDFLRAGR